jgi:hypothetical protein
MLVEDPAVGELADPRDFCNWGLICSAVHFRFSVKRVAINWWPEKEVRLGRSPHRSSNVEAAMVIAVPVPPYASLRGWLVSVQTTERVEWYAVGASNIGKAHSLVAEYCKANLSHAVRLERPLTDVEIDALQLQHDEVKPFKHSV